MRYGYVNGEMEEKLGIVPNTFMEISFMQNGKLRVFRRIVVEGI